MVEKYFSVYVLKRMTSAGHTSIRHNLVLDTTFTNVCYLHKISMFTFFSYSLLSHFHVGLCFP